MPPVGGSYPPSASYPSPFEPWIDVTGGGAAGGKCGTDDGYTHPDYTLPGTAAPDPSDSPSGTPVNPYAMSGAQQSAGCRATTGT